MNPLAWTLVIGGLFLIGPGTASAALFTGGAGSAYGSGASPDVLVSSLSLTSTPVSLTRHPGPSADVTLTVQDDLDSPLIKAGTPIVVRIPDGLPMVWDASRLAPTVTGSAAAKAGAVTYASGARNLVIAVLSDFSAGDSLTIGGLAFALYLDGGRGSLGLDVTGDGAPETADARTLAILCASYSGGADDGCAAGGTGDVVLTRPGGLVIVIR